MNEQTSLQEQFSLASLEYGLFRKVIEKFDYKQYAVFEECCHFSYVRSLNLPNITFGIEVDKLQLYNYGFFLETTSDTPVKIEVPRDSKAHIKVKDLLVLKPLDEEDAVFLRSKIRGCYGIHLTKHWICSEKTICNLVKHSKIEGFRCDEVIYETFINNRLYCTLEVYNAEEYPLELLFSINAEYTYIISEGIPINTIISKFAELQKSQKTQRTFLRLNYTLEEVKEALVQLGDASQPNTNESQFSDPIHWMITMENTDPVLIYYTPSKKQ